MSIDSAVPVSNAVKRRSAIVQQRARCFDRLRTLQPVLKRLAGAEPVDVPGVELAQVAGWRARRRDARRHCRAPSRPRPGSRLGVGSPSRTPSSCSNSHGLPSEPRASATALAPVRSNASRASCGSPEPARQHDRDRQRLDQRPGELVVRRTGVALRSVARMDAEPGDPAVFGQPAGKLDPAAIAGAQARAQLDGDRQAAAARRRARDGDRALGLGQQRRPGAGLAHLREPGSPC